MAVRFARPDLSTLVFQIYSRSVHPELLPAFGKNSVIRDSYQAEIRLCEAGHAVSIRVGNRTVTEVLTSNEQRMPQKQRLIDRPVSQSREETLQLESGLIVHAHTQLEKLDTDLFLNVHEEMLLDCQRADLSHCFPGNSRLAPGPISLIRLDPTRDGLLVHSYHTFPESSAIVKTQSLFELADG